MIDGRENILYFLHPMLIIKMKERWGEGIEGRGKEREGEKEGVPSQYPWPC